MAHDVFISYSAQDQPFADAACAALESKGIRCWIAPRDVAPGADLGASIVRAIAEARVFVLVFSSSANTSPQIKREVERAADRGLAVIPVRVEDAKPGESLEHTIRAPHWLDAFPPPLEQHLIHLADLVRDALGRRAAASSKPVASEPPPRPRRAIVYGVAGLALVVSLVAAGWFGARLFQSDAPRIDPVCLIETEVPSQNACASLLALNPHWQDCSAAFASQDMDKAVKRATRMLDNHVAASVIYYDPRFYGKAYGTISHYWEMFGQCVNENYLPFEQIYSGVSFPEVYWNKTRQLRQLFRDNWAGRTKPLPDFMSNFRDLCTRYKAKRNTLHPGDGDALNCTL
jgi:hypothetical protein